jgi:cytochrome c oxidase cbb3-type subunit 3
VDVAVHHHRGVSPRLPGLYPGLGSNEGFAEVDQRRPAWEAEQDKARAAMAPVYAKYVSCRPSAGQGRAGHGIGERLFANNCAQCHGSDARGSKGFPNLADGDWLGGTHDYIKETITNGRRA